MSEGSAMPLAGLFMAEKEEAQNTIRISEEAQERVKKAVEDAFRGLSEHTRQITEEMAAFDRRRQEMRGRMKNGVRRTSGRIV